MAFVSINGSDKSGCGKFLHISVILHSQLQNKFMDTKNTWAKEEEN